MSNLALSQLTKTKARVKIFCQKLVNKKKFQMVDNTFKTFDSLEVIYDPKQVILKVEKASTDQYLKDVDVFADTLYLYIKPANEQSTKKIKCHVWNSDKPDEKYSTSKLLKTKEFGGGGGIKYKASSDDWGILGQYVKDPRFSSYKLNTPSPTEQYEYEVIQTINREITSYIDKFSVPIDIKMGKYTFTNIIGCNKIPGYVKADLALVQLKDDKLVDVGFFSHKAGRTAREFNQWGGITDYKNTSIFNDIIKPFIDACKLIYVPEGRSPGDTFIFNKYDSGVTIIEPFFNKKIKCESIFGIDYNMIPAGINAVGSKNNIHCAIQGNISLKLLNDKEDRILLELVTTAHIFNNCDGDNVDDDYDPVLLCLIKSGATGAEARKVDRSQFGLLGARFGLYPKKNRPVKAIILRNFDGGANVTYKQKDGITRTGFIDNKNTAITL